MDHGVGETSGEVVGMSGGLPAGDGLSNEGGLRLGVGNANVADGAADGIADVPGEGDVDVGLGDGDRLGVGVGVGGGGMMFAQRCSGTVAPPISFTSVWERA